MKSFFRIFVVGLLAGCASAPIQSEGPLKVPLKLKVITLYFDPQYRPPPSKGDTGVANRAVPMVARLSAAFADGFMRSFPDVLKRHGVVLIQSPKDGVPLLYLEIGSMNRSCGDSSGCYTQIEIVGALVTSVDQASSKTLWKFSSWINPETMDLDKFREYENQLVEKMIADGVITDSAAP